MKNSFDLSKSQTIFTLFIVSIITIANSIKYFVDYFAASPWYVRLIIALLAVLLPMYYSRQSTLDQLRAIRSDRIDKIDHLFLCIARYDSSPDKDPLVFLRSHGYFLSLKPHFSKTFQDLYDSYERFDKNERENKGRRLIDAAIEQINELKSRWEIS